MSNGKEEKRCIKCQEWFIPKLRTQKFCSRKCRRSHYENVFNKSIKRLISRHKYYRKHRKEEIERVKKYYHDNKK